MSHTPRELLPQFWLRALATFFGTGCAPAAQGTVASALALALIAAAPASCWPWLPLGLAALATLLCVFIARRFPGKSEGGDPHWFTLDEAAGQWLAVAAFSKPSLPVLLIAFAVFRAADILKPPPLRRWERLGGGFGIVADDLGAGLYALLPAHLAAFVWPSL